MSPPGPSGGTGQEVQGSMRVYHAQLSDSPKPIRVPGGRVIGRVIEEAGRRVFVRHVTWARHFFRLGDGWSLSASVLAQLERHGVSLIRYFDDDRGIWEVALADLLRLAERRHYGEEQFILPRARWSHTAALPSPKQVALFAVGGAT